MCRRAILLLIAVAFLTAGDAEARTWIDRGAQTREVVLPPNVVVIVGDDLGWNDHGFMGNPTVQTPTLDSLAETGVVFPNGHLWASLCNPSQRGMLTGVHHSLSIGPVAEWATLPRVIARSETRDYRYRTFQAGKLWNVGPTEWGFQEDAGDERAALASRGNPAWGREDWDPHRCGSLATRDDPCPATTAWVDFLDSLRPADGERFFALFTPEIPHGPPTPPQRYRDLYEPAELVGFQAHHYPMTTWLDELVWEILDGLTQRGVRGDTLVVYLVDNGYNSTVWLDSQDRGKGSLSELGFRTPVILNGPGATGGRTYPDLVTVGDIFVTISEITGSTRFMDPMVRGHSLVCRTTRGEPASRRTEIITAFGRADQGKIHGVIVRTPQWRYVRDDSSGTTGLFAIDRDPLELNDLADTLTPEARAGFEGLIEEWRRGLTTPAQPSGRHPVRRSRRPSRCLDGPTGKNE